MSNHNKKNKASKAPELTTQENKKVIGWSVGEYKISYKDAHEVMPYKGGHTIYGFVPQEFGDWKPYLEKGLAKTAFGSNGVKFLNKSILELKNCSDERLYVSKLYANSKGDYLAIFDQETDHKGIIKLAPSSKDMVIFPCDDYCLMGDDAIAEH